jgi:hypothetical protein
MPAPDRGLLVLLRCARNPVHLLIPPALGRGCPPLWGASAVTNLGDGALLAAGPLLLGPTRWCGARSPPRSAGAPSPTRCSAGSPACTCWPRSVRQALGSVFGGLLAQWLGLTAPFWIAASGIALLTVLGWRPLAAAETGRSTFGHLR